jgi:hypothetical protein
LVIVSEIIAPKAMVSENCFKFKSITQKTYFDISQVAEKQLFASQ